MFCIGMNFNPSPCIVMIDFNLISCRSCNDLFLDIRVGFNLLDLGGCACIVNI